MNNRDTITRKPVLDGEVAEVADSRALPGWVVLVAAMAPVGVTAGWIAGDAVQRDTYSPMEQTVSVLAGYGAQDRWVMTSALFVVVASYLVSALALRTVPRRARFGLFVASLAGLGIALFPQPAHGSRPEHMLFTAIGEVLLALWPVLLVRRSAAGVPGPLTARVCWTVTAVFTVLLVWLVVELHVDSQLGLAERLSVTVQTAWPFVVAFSIWHASRRRLGWVAPWSGSTVCAAAVLSDAVAATAQAAGVATPAWRRAIRIALVRSGVHIPRPQSHLSD